MYSINLCSFGLPSHELNVANDFVVSNLESLEALLYERYGFLSDGYYILCNGQKIDCLKPESGHDIVNKTLQVIPRTFGGKGGFGSMLRAIGAQIEKTTNREACRDLSGRRLRDINEEKRLKKWIAQQEERAREASENKKKKLERLCQEPKHDFKDEKYTESRSNMPKEITSAIEKGIQAVHEKDKPEVGVKRKSKDESGSSCKAASKLTKKRKKNLWIDAEESDNSEESSACESDIETKLNSKLSLPTSSSV